VFKLARLGCAKLTPERTYSSVVSSNRMTGAKGAFLGVLKTTSLIVAPRDDLSSKFVMSRDTREALLREVKPSDFNLRVKSLLSGGEQRCSHRGTFRGSAEIQGVEGVERCGSPN